MISTAQEVLVLIIRHLISIDILHTEMTMKEIGGRGTGREVIIVVGQDVVHHTGVIKEVLQDLVLHTEAIMIEALLGTVIKKGTEKGNEREIETGKDITERELIMKDVNMKGDIVLAHTEVPEATVEVMTHLVKEVITAHQASIAFVLLVEKCIIYLVPVEQEILHLILEGSPL